MTRESPAVSSEDAGRGVSIGASDDPNGGAFANWGRFDGQSAARWSGGPPARRCLPHAAGPSFRICDSNPQTHPRPVMHPAAALFPGGASAKRNVSRFCPFRSRLALNPVRSAIPIQLRRVVRLSMAGLLALLVAISRARAQDSLSPSREGQPPTGGVSIEVV